VMAPLLHHASGHDRGATALVFKDHALVVGFVS